MVVLKFYLVYFKSQSNPLIKLMLTTYNEKIKNHSTVNLLTLLEIFHVHKFRFWKSSLSFMIDYRKYFESIKITNNKKCGNWFEVI